MKEIVKITIPRFNEYIRLAEKKSVKPFVNTSKRKIPKKYQTEEFKWDAKGRLVNALTGLVVASNPITAGKPRDWRINGQDIYNQKVKHNARQVVMQKMHDKFTPYLRDIPALNEFPVTVQIDFYLLDEKDQKGRANNIDNDNRWIYHKVVQDTLTELGKIPDDNPYYITGNVTHTYFVETKDDVKVDIIIFKEDDE